MIKVGYCVAYDWEMLKKSVPTIYNEADVICLSVDKYRRSWSGAPFSWNEAGFREMVSCLDPLNKIRVYEDDFYNPDLSPMQNEVNQRRMIASFLGESGWHVQLDADEYFIDFEKFVNYLNEFKSTRKVNICCPLVNLYKELPEGMLWIKPSSFKNIEFCAIATRYPDYEYGRKNRNFDVFTNFPILHQSWARSESEIWEKLNNWGHAKDFDVKKYFKYWKDVNIDTYKSYRNFHHLRGEAWPSLELLPDFTTTTLMSGEANKSFSLPITNKDLILKNSLWFSRLKKLSRMILKK